MHYGEPVIRRAVPLALGYACASNPLVTVLDTLSKYSHDHDQEVALNAIFAMGLVGAGTNNARLAQMLRQLATYYGKDPNWGRVLAATGTAEAEFDALNIDVKLNGIQVCTASAPAADRNLVTFEDRLVEIEINLNSGSASATILTNDLTHDYVHENSAYAT